MNEDFITPREYRQSEQYNFDHFIRLQSTGLQFGTISVDYESIEVFAYDYAKHYHRQALKEVLERLYQASCDFKMHPVDRLAMLRELIEKEYEQSKLQDDE